MSADAPAKPSNHVNHNSKKRKREDASDIQRQRSELPIAAGKDAIVERIRKNDVTVLLGETGSGKTTQIPQYILEAGLAGDGLIGITQPRRVAATSLAARVAAEQEVPLGSRVGYSVRFDEKTSPNTKIKYLTDGMIMRELMSDPLLTRYKVIIVDEAHERTVRTDILIASLKRIQKERVNPPQVNGHGSKSKHKENKLKILIMSATMDAEKFSKFFDNADIVYIKGRTHPVTVYHTKDHQPDYVEAALRTFYQIHTDCPEGDVLVFLPGQEDIESLESSIKHYANRLPQSSPDVLICTMFAGQPASKLEKIFRATPPRTRKCILATNIAETSITIPGIKYVIDTGKHKLKNLLAKDKGAAFDTLLTRDISQSSAMQRTGRAGRESAGYCYRLYTEEAFQSMRPAIEPEIVRVRLTSPILDLLCLGIELEKLDLLDRPDQDNVIFAFTTLFFLGAIDNHKKVTDLGRKMSYFPLEPNHARVILASQEHGCTREVVDIISVMSASSKLFYDVSEQRDAISEARAKFRHPAGDHLTILNVVRSYEQIVSENTHNKKHWCRKHFVNDKALNEAMSIRNQLRQSCSRAGLDWKASCGENGDGSPILQSLAAALVQNAALLQPDGTYKQILGPATIKIHPGSTMSGKKVPAIIYDELVYTTDIYARGVSSVLKSALRAPSLHAN